MLFPLITQSPGSYSRLYIVRIIVRIVQVVRIDLDQAFQDIRGFWYKDEDFTDQ